MFNLCLRFLSLILLSSFFSNILFASDGSPLLKGKINVSEPTEVAVVYDYDGDNYVQTVKTAADGSFVFDFDLPAEAVDVLVYVESEPFGAYLKRGETTVMDIDKGGDVAFSGDNLAENKFLNAYTRGFYPMQYKPSPDLPFVLSDYLDRLEKNAGEARRLLASVKEPRKSRYSRMTDAYYNEVLLRLLGMDSSYSKTDHKAQMDSIIATIDPNADESRLTGITNYWYNRSDIHRKGNAASIIDYMKDQFAGIDSVLTNEGNKKSLWMTLGSMFMMYSPSENDVQDFFAAVEPQLSRAPMVKERIMEVYESMKPKVSNGDVVPTDPVIISPDGSKCHLSDLLGESVVYIDIWATWCGPCCREIPYMEKVVEQFKGNEGITFISISRDDSRQAWLKKLDRDKPEWPQYIFDKSSGDEFMNAMSITGIPRFLLIGKDRKFISVDAERPSNEKIAEILNAAIGKE